MSNADAHRPKKDQWSAQTYSAAASFVPHLTTKALRLLDPQSTDRVLDVGCGDGKFTANYLPHVAAVLGVDASESFVASANADYGPGAAAGRSEGSGKAAFKVVDCRFLDQDREAVDGAWDKAVSNAALHWILRDPATRVRTLRAIHTSLRPGGVFVFEMGGAGNVAEALTALTLSLHHTGGLSMDAARAANPWFFPSESEMRVLLEQAGFTVGEGGLELEYRPTKLTSKDVAGGGLEGWVRLMGGSMLEKVEGENRREEVVREVCEGLKDVVGREDGSEWLGYVRLRGVATKAS